jgi:DNA-binding transcriptional ArsR family regulator
MEKDSISCGRETVKLKGIVAASLVLVLAFSFASLLQKQKDADNTFLASVQTAASGKLNLRTANGALNYPSQYYNLLIFWADSTYQGTVAEKAPLPDNTTRTEIFNFINANPGVQFRAICGGLGLSIGVVQFHLAQLQKSRLITSLRKGRYKRFFASGKFSLKEMDTIATLRLSTVRSILKTLLEGKRVSHHELAMWLEISSQGLTWQMNRLRETGLVEETRCGVNVSYALKQTYVGLVAQTIALVE